MRAVLSSSFAVLAIVLVACNAILGIEDRNLRPDDAGLEAATLADGGASADAASEAGALSASTYRDIVLAAGPILYLRFGEAEDGGTIAHDEIGKETDGGLYPVSGVTRGVSGALDGSTDTAIALNTFGAISVPRSADFAGTAAFSVEVWVNWNGNGGFIVDHESYPRAGWSLFVGEDVSFERRGNGKTLLAATPPDASLRPFLEWHHIVGVWTGTAAKLFVDNEEQQVTNIDNDAPIPGLDAGWTIGGPNCACTGNFFEGKLDELAIYEKALGPDEIAAHFHAAGR